jgi:hypothetical protein
MSRRKSSRAPRKNESSFLPVLYVITGLTVVAAVGIVLGFLFLGGSGTGSAQVPAGYPYPVQAITRIQDRSHFPVGQTYDNYNSNPPTSGPHAAVPANWGISDVAIAKEQALHNMEHAGVVVWYNCNAQPILSAQDCTTLRNQLGSVVQAEVGAGKRVLMTPYAGMDQRIALTAWGFLDTFETFDQARVQKFIETFECNFDPEHFCG